MPTNTCYPQATLKKIHDDRDACQYCVALAVDRLARRVSEIVFEAMRIGQHESDAPIHKRPKAACCRKCSNLR